MGKGKLKRAVGPHFLGVGMRKSGTTWLYRQLIEHPEISMPVIKEMRYFFEGENLPRHSIFNFIFSPHGHYVGLRRKFKKRFSIPRSHEDRAAFWEYFRYYFFRHTHSWYMNSFDATKISGEFTPGYWAISEKKIQSISDDFPNLKVIFILREPVSRLWSSFKMFQRQNNNPDSLDNIGLDNPNLQTILQQNLSYVSILEKWSKYFDDVQVYYLDDVIADSQAFLKNVYAHLGCKNVDFQNSNVAIIPNKNDPRPIPRKLQLELVDIYKPHVLELANYTKSNVPLKWMEKYEQTSKTQLSE